jgi:glycylpeptide N-tetradecanoyltransferase
LPDGFEFDTFDVTDDATVNDICKFIEDHYVESQDFRVIYTPEKFRWALMTPGWVQEYHFVVRNSKNKKIMALMVGCPKKYNLAGKTLIMLEGNFFAIHKKLRNKRLAPIMSQEMFRRQRKNGINQTYMTSAGTFPTPFTSCHYYNKYINCEKLIDIRYTGLGSLNMK